MRRNDAGGSPPLSPLVRTNAAAALALLSAVCLAMVAFRKELLGETRFLFMLWNLFLAWLPYVAAVAAGAAARLFPKGSAAGGAVIFVIGILWLLFLPNTAYLTTDVIHLIAGLERYADDGQFGYLVWYDLVLFSLFAWCGIVLGYLSTFRFHQLAAIRFGKAGGWLFVAVVSLLHGYGVFLGRIVRLNSWDAWTRPAELAADVLGNLHWRGAAFSLLFSLFAAATYVTLYHLQEGKR